MPQVVYVACWQVCQSGAIGGPPALALMSGFCSFRNRPTPVTVPPVPTPVGPRRGEGHAACFCTGGTTGCGRQGNTGQAGAGWQGLLEQGSGQARDGGGCWSSIARSHLQ